MLFVAGHRNLIRNTTQQRSHLCIKIGLKQYSDILYRFLPFIHMFKKIVLPSSSYTTVLKRVMRLDCHHPRRPRGSQSGREKSCDESFQAWVEEPLSTDSHQTISKRSSECWLLIGHKKCFVLLCPIGQQFLLSSFREFVHDGYRVPKCDVIENKICE